MGSRETFITEMSSKDLLFLTVSVLLLFSADAQEEYPSEETFEGSGSFLEGSGSSEEGDWTCQECRDGSIGVGDFYVERAQIASQGEHLLSTVNICGDHPSPGVTSQPRRQSPSG